MDFNFIFPKKIQKENRKQSNKSKSFTWSVPSLSLSNKLLLCHGYTRNNHPTCLISDIIDLFALFYSPDLFTIDHIRTPHEKYQREYFSQIFNHGALKFYLELWPDGINTHNKG